MATLKKITDAIKLPMRKVLDTDLRTLFIDNPAALDLWIYGNRQPSGVNPGHNHGSTGGELLKGTLLSFSCGPYQHENTFGSSFLRGQPLTRQGGGYSPPKLQLAQLCTIPAGVTRIRGALLGFTGAAAGSVTLIAGLRPVLWHNAKYIDPSTSGIHAVKTITWNASSGYALLNFTLEVADIQKAKNLLTAARCEFVLFQSSTLPGAGDWLIVGGELWVDDDPTYSLPVSSSADPPKGEVTFSDLLTGKLLLTQLSAKIKARWNGIFHALLGRAPGLGGDGVVVDRARRWRRRIKGAHRHTGIIVPDSSGGYYSDGACLLYPSKAASWFGRYWGENISALRTAAGTQAQGLKIHSGGALDASWLSWDYSIDLEAGLAGLTAQVSLEPTNNDPAAKLFIHLGVYQEGSSTNLLRAIRCDFHNSEPTQDAGGLWVCELEPEENDSWVPNANMRLVGKGVYTTLAKKPSAQLFVTEAINAYRVSKPIKFEISHPAYHSDGTARATGRYVLRVRLSLKLSSGYDAGARVLSFEAVASPGY